jgi:glycosyltransferase involved in cell wall biosynthesis
VSTPTLQFVHATTFYPPDGFGGDAVQVHRLANLLAERGHQVRVVHNPEAFDRGEGAPLTGFPNHPGVEVVALKTGRRGLLASHLLGRPSGFGAQLSATLAGADVVHFHNPSLLGGPGALALSQAPVTVYTTHEHWLVCPTHVLFRNGREPCERQTCWRCSAVQHRPPQVWRSTGAMERGLSHVDLLLSPSEFTAERHRRAFPQVACKVLRHPPPSFKELETLPPIEARARPFVLFAGRFEPIKGGLWLIEQLRETGVDLVLAGDGSQLEQARLLAAGHPAVHVLGKVDRARLLGLCRDALALIVPSLGYETAGAVALEAMALGTPVIVRELGALPELVTNGGGLTFRTGEELRAHVTRLANDPGLHAELSTQARATADPSRAECFFLNRYFTLLAEAAANKGDSTLAAAASACAAAS